MKKILTTLIFIFGLISSVNLPAKADVMPYYVNNINTNSIGVYQASKNIKIYKEPNEHSPLLLDVTWDSQTFDSPEVSASNLFIVFLPRKELAFLIVTDETENWVEVVFCKNGNQKGWVKKDDEYKFQNWRTFYNWYGRKYGLYFMKDAPEFTQSMYGSNSDDAQKIDKINLPQTLKMTAIKGNWLLVNVFDMDKLVKIGWIKWRNTSGEIYLFPAIK
jgi:hypothetical protein